MGCHGSKASCLAVADMDAPSGSPSHRHPDHHRHQQQQQPGPTQADDEALSVIPLTHAFEEDFVVGKLLGKGSFGKVYHVLPRHESESEEVMSDGGGQNGATAGLALKVIEVGKGVKATSIVREWRVLEHLGTHPSCVRYYRTYRSRERVAFLFELLPGGELFERLIKFGPVSETEARVQIGRLIHGLRYFHERGIVHRDLKPENLLLTHPFTDDRANLPLSERLREERWKCSDFGLSQLIGKHERLLKICGTWAYSPPQSSLVTGEKKGYTVAFDCFSMGVISFVVLSGSHPFDPTGTLPINEIKARARSVTYTFAGEEWRHISTAAKDFIARLMMKEEEDRMSAAEAVQHPWIAGISSPLVATPRSLSLLAAGSSSSSASSPRQRLKQYQRQQQYQQQRDERAGRGGTRAAVASAGADVIRLPAISMSSAAVRSRSPPPSPSPSPGSVPSLAIATTTTTTAAGLDNVMMTAGEASPLGAAAAVATATVVTPGNSPRLVTATMTPMPTPPYGPRTAQGLALRRHEVDIASPMSPETAIAQGLFSPPAAPAAAAAAAALSLSTGNRGGGGAAGRGTPDSAVRIDRDPARRDQEQAEHASAAVVKGKPSHVSQQQESSTASAFYRQPFTTAHRHRPGLQQALQQQQQQQHQTKRPMVSRETPTVAPSSSIACGAREEEENVTPLTGVVTASSTKRTDAKSKHQTTSSHFGGIEGEGSAINKAATAATAVSPRSAASRLAIGPAQRPVISPSSSASSSSSSSSASSTATDAAATGTTPGTGVAVAAATTSTTGTTNALRPAKSPPGGE